MSEKIDPERAVPSTGHYSIVLALTLFAIGSYAVMLIYLE